MEDATKIEIAKRIYQKRKQLLNKRGKPTTQKELADIVGVDVQTIVKYESVTKKNTVPNMKVEILYKMAKAFGVTTDWLLCLTDKEGIDIDETMLERRFGLSEKAIQNLGNIASVDFRLDEIDVEKKFKDSLKERDYLNAIISSKYFIELYGKIMVHCVYSNIINVYLKHIEIPRKEEINRFELMKKGQLAYCQEITELLIEDVASVIDKMLDEKIQSLDTSNDKGDANNG